MEHPPLDQIISAFLKNKTTELSMTVTGQQGQNLSVVFYSADFIGVARTEISVSLGHCGLGYVFDNDSLKCMCHPHLEKLDVTCDVDSLQAPDNFWVGRVDDMLGVVRCPTEYCDTIPLKQGEHFDVQCLLSRTGVGCRDCKKGRSLVLGSERCSKCSNYYIFLFLVFIALGVFLIVVVYYVDITLATGLLNGVIFFSNLITLYAAFLFPNFPHIGFITFLSLNCCCFWQYSWLFCTCYHFLLSFFFRT